VAYAEDANTPANEGPFVEFDFGQFVMPIRPNPMTFEEVPTSAGPTSISMTAATATAVGVDPSQIQYRFTPADPNLVGDPGDPNARGLGTLRDWGSGRTYIDTGLAPNTRYGYQTQARIGTSPSIVTHPSDVMVACTLANPPLAPTVENATSETLDVTINPSDGNHDLTLYAIRNLTRDRWISVGGVEAFSPVWQTRAAWGTVTVLFLQADTDYQFACRARNADGVETADGPATSETTLEGGSGDDGGGDDGGGGGDGGDGTGSVQFSQLPTAVSSSSVEMWASTTWEAPNPPVQYYFEELSRNRGGSSSGWLGVAYHFDAGLEENTRYSYRVKAGDSGVPQNETPYSAVAHVYTLAAEPPAPDITNRKSNSVDVTVSRGDNPPETLLAVKNKTEGVYLDGQGRGSATEVWQVELDWGLITVDGLQPDKSYEFFCIAKNGDGKLAVGPSSLAKAATPEKGKKDPQSMTVEGDTTVNEWSQSAPYKVMAHYEDAPDEEVTARVSWELSTTQWGRITEHGGVLHAHEVFSNQQVEVRANITDAKVPVTPMRVTIVNIPGATKPVDPNEAGKLAPGDGTAGAGTDGGTAQTTPDAGPFCPFASLSISLALVGGILALRRRRA